MFALYTNDLLKKCKNRVIKKATCFQRGSEFIMKMPFIKKMSFVKEKSETATKVKLVGKF